MPLPSESPKNQRSKYVLLPRKPNNCFLRLLLKKWNLKKTAANPRPSKRQISTTGGTFRETCRPKKSRGHRALSWCTSSRKEIGWWWNSPTTLWRRYKCSAVLAQNKFSFGRTSEVPPDSCLAFRSAPSLDWSISWPFCCVTSSASWSALIRSRWAPSA